MINVTPIARMVLMHNAKSALQAAHAPQSAQEATLARLLERGKLTKWGEEHNYAAINNYADFKRAVPVQGYEAFRPYAMRMVNGETDVLWPGVCKRFAQSSGTSGGKSKYIPITHEALRINHYAGAATSVALYLLQHPHSRMFAGKGFILGGSYANELDLPAGVKVGDLSASLIDKVNPLVEMYRIPHKEIALMEDWRQKLPVIIEASMDQDITNLSGVPSWFLTVLKGVIEKKGAATIHDVWPNLEVFFHGGIAFGPYREEYAKITSPNMRYWENYNASEGFFAAQAFPGDPGMIPMLCHGAFYELVPIEQAGDPHPDAIPIWEAEPGRTYSLVVTACNGLWRYAIGDTIRIESVDPLKFTIAGRTTSFINAFGEEVMEHNTDRALAAACKQHGCSILNYTVAPVYTHGADKGHHQWLIEWGTKPADMAEFERTLDLCLQSENSDYQAKRQGDIFLAQLKVVSAYPETFNHWLAATGKLGGQRKVPRLSNDRKIMDQLLKIT